MVIVTPSDMPPVKYNGRICIRRGPRQAIANENEERILNENRRYHHMPFDLSPIPAATLDDLSKTIFDHEYLVHAFSPDILEQNGRTYEERLSSCKLIVSPTDPSPTLLGLVSIGIQPQDFLPGAYIQFLRLNGTELTDSVIDEAECRGYLSDMLRRSLEKIQAHNYVAVDVTSRSTHQKTPTYPREAIEQLLYNAVLHRSYEKTHAPIRVYWFDDRIEIHSPGGPYGNVTCDNFGQPGITDYRNPNLCEAMKVFGFVQAFGRGIAIARKSLNDHGHPALTFEVNESYVVCTIKRKP